MCLTRKLMEVCQLGRTLILMILTMMTMNSMMLLKKNNKIRLSSQLREVECKENKLRLREEVHLKMALFSEDLLMTTLGQDKKMFIIKALTMVLLKA